MSNPLVLTFDIGTQSMRSVIISKKGELLAFEQLYYDEPYFSLQPRWAEQKPNFYFDKLCELSKRTKKKYKDLYKDIIAVTLTTFRDTTLCLDKNYKPLRDIILWLDKRETDHAVTRTPLWLNIVLRLVGMKDIIEMQQRMTSANWIMENESSIWQKTDKFVLLPTYLNYLMTGKLIDSVANLVGHIPMNYKKRKWVKGFGIMKFIANISGNKLCDICDAGDTIGYITDECAERTGIAPGLPLIATGSDKSCEALGLSVLKDHQAAISFGTASTVQVLTKKYYTPAPFVPSYPSAVRGHYNAEVQIYRGFWMLSWFKNHFAQEEVIEAKKQGISVESLLCKKLSTVPAGCEGLVLQPYWGPGVETPNARGTIIGFSDVHTKMHMFRAIIEGILFALLDGMYTLERRAKRNITELYVAGGGSQSEEVCQIAANMSGLPVYTVQTHEACCIGSSIVAFISQGEFSSHLEAAKEMCHIKKEYLPNKTEYATYQEIYKNVYVGIYPRLLPLFKSIKRITKRSKQ